MQRVDVIHQVLQANQGTRYLEIGVSRGITFAQIDAPTKIAVDPTFRFRVPPPALLRTRLKQRTGTLYFEIESDTFFDRHGDRLAPFDAVLIDGLHTADQTYRDILHAIERLSPGGVIVVHDCNPQSAAAAAPTLEVAATMPGYDGGWNGDVFKSIVRLRARHPGLHTFVLDCDQGLGIVRAAPGDDGGSALPAPALSDDEIAGLTYDDLDGDRTELLDLRPPEALEPVLASVAAIASSARGSPDFT